MIFKTGRAVYIGKSYIQFKRFVIYDIEYTDITSPVIVYDHFYKIYKKIAFTKRISRVSMPLKEFKKNFVKF